MGGITHGWVLTAISDGSQNPSVGGSLMTAMAVMREAHGWVLTAISMSDGSHGWVMTASLSTDGRHNPWVGYDCHQY